MNNPSSAARAIACTQSASRLAAVTVALLTAACTTSPVLHSSPAKSAQAGFVYALPKGQVQLDAASKVITPEDVAAAQKDADAAKAAQTAADQAVQDAKKALTDAQAAADAVTSDPAEQARKEDLDGMRVVAAFLVRARTAQASAAKLLAGEAGKRLAELQTKVGKTELSVALKPLPPVADVAHRYVATANPSQLRDDTIKLTASNGLLNTGATESVGQAGAILVNLVSAVAGAKAPKGNLGLRTFRDKSLLEQAACKPFNYSVVFDPTNKADVDAVSAELAVRAQHSLNLSKPSAAKATHAGITESIGGLAYRPPVTLTVEVQTVPGQPCAPAGAPAYASLTATMPDSTEVYFLPVEAGSFTKSKVDYAFKDGTPISFASERPSQAAAIARLPVEILKAMVEVPASIVKLRVDYDSQAVALTQNQTKLLNAQVDLLKAQDALRDAEEAAGQK